MKTIQVASFSRLILSSPMTFDFMGATISNEQDPNSIINKSFYEYFGEREVLLVIDNPTLVYCVIEQDINRNSVDDLRERYVKDTRIFMAYTKLIDTFLWFVKDSDVFVDTILSVSFNIKTGARIAAGDYRFSPILTNSAAIQDTPPSFTREELDLALNVCNKFNEICPDYLAQLTSDEHIYEKLDNRLEKSLKFVIEARKSSFLMAKMAMYMSALECLFSTDGGDLTFKISTRTAFYICNTKEDRVEVFNDIKQAYDFRSKYLHGGTVDRENKRKKKYLSPLSSRVDSIVRKVLHKAIMQDGNIFIPPKGAIGVPLNNYNEMYAKFLKELTL